LVRVVGPLERGGTKDDRRGESSIDEDDAAVGFTELTIVTNLFFELSKDDNDDDCLFVVVITLNEYDNTHIEMINNRILIDFDMIYYYYLLLL